MKKVVMMLMVSLGLGLTACNDSNKNNDKAPEESQTQNDPVVKEALFLTDQSQSSFEQSEAKSLDQVNEVMINDREEPFLVKF